MVQRHSHPSAPLLRQAKYEEIEVAREGFCITCERTVYISKGGSDSCPVCSSPLVDQPSEASITLGSIAPANP